MLVNISAALAAQNKMAEHLNRIATMLAERLALHQGSSVAATAVRQQLRHLRMYIRARSHSLSANKEPLEFDSIDAMIARGDNETEEQRREFVQALTNAITAFNCWAENDGEIPGDFR